MNPRSRRASRSRDRRPEVPPIGSPRPVLQPAQPTSRSAWPILLVAVLATVAVGLTVPPWQGPGITCDELYYTATGKHYVLALRQLGWRMFSPAQIDGVFAEQIPQPPLGRWLLGAAHFALDRAPDDPAVLSIVAARFAPALAFGLLVALTGLTALREEGTLGGLAAAAAVVLVPRMFGHAHLATLDVFSVLFCFAAVVAVAGAQRRGTWRNWALAGAVWGLALLTKQQALLLVVPVAVWMFAVYRRGAVVPLVIWLSSGAAVMLVGWPWLWVAPIERPGQYLASAGDRLPLNVFYLGKSYPDTEAPWHYPIVMLVVTLPAGLLLVGIAGLVRDLYGVWHAARHVGHRSGRQVASGRHAAGLRLLTLGTFLVMFGLPGVPVYDGIRLFLLAVPLWAMLVGSGVTWLAGVLRRKGCPGPVVAIFLVVFLALQGTGIVRLHPFYLSHYNLLVGGLSGASRLGFETTYWGDTIDESLLEVAAAEAAGNAVLYAPHLAPFQALGVQSASPSLRAAGVGLEGYDPLAPRPHTRGQLVLVYRRRADEELWQPLAADAQVVAESTREGVWLARLVRLPPPE